jgi:DNA-binding response OmpR family regulator
MALGAWMRRVLLLEDDEVSRQFLTEALQILPIELQVGNCFQEASGFCKQYRYDLIICDMNLTDGTLLKDYTRLPASVPVLAISAEMSTEIRSALALIGIRDILAKPMSVQQLHAAITAILAQSAQPSEIQLWNAAQAERALGNNPLILVNLKQLFARELEQMRAEISHAFEQQSHQQIHQSLHKLKASCGFLGADRLLKACEQLDADIGQATFSEFLQVLQETQATI